MFQANEGHLQAPLLSGLNELSAKTQARLEASWAGTFYREGFVRLDERPFAVLYAATDSRPNTAVNVLVGLEILKAGFGWSDEELYDHFLYDVQVRYALGYRNLGEGEFSLRTVYNFRRRLSAYMQQTGVNLLEAAFAQVTGEQMQSLHVHSHQLRMDSTQIASNIRETSRLHLLVEVVQRVVRILTAAECAAYAELLGPYTQGSASQYLYQLAAGEHPSHIARIGSVMHQLVLELGEHHGQTSEYQTLQRVFAEHFVWTATEQRPKQAAELSAHSLQSPDDVDATFRRKRNVPHRGYATNATETCDADNAVQLVVLVQTAPNAMDDGQFLVEALPALLERTEVECILTDGGYNGPEPDRLLADYQLKHEQTAIRGGTPRVGIDLSHFTVKYTDDPGQRTPQCITCPQHQTVAVTPGVTVGNFFAHFDPVGCAACPLTHLCPATRTHGPRQHVIYFKRHDLRLAAKRQQLRQPLPHFNLRAAVESTMRALVHHLPHDKAPVRGRFRVTCYMVAAAFMVNLRRIHAYAVRKQHRAQPAWPAQRIFTGLRCVFVTLLLPLALFGQSCAHQVAPSPPRFRFVRLSSATVYG